jgi:hypothetical protein
MTRPRLITVELSGALAGPLSETPTDRMGQNAFSNFSRYETAIEQGLYKALHELQRLQADRAPAGSIPPPVAVDVDAPELPSGISERLALFGNNRI